MDPKIEEVYQVPLTKGQMNPTLRNIRERNVNIDSRFRPNLSDSTSDFIVDLNEPLQFKNEEPTD